MTVTLRRLDPDRRALGLHEFRQATIVPRVNTAGTFEATLDPDQAVGLRRGVGVVWSDEVGTILSGLITRRRRVDNPEGVEGDRVVVIQGKGDMRRLSGRLAYPDPGLEADDPAQPATWDRSGPAGEVLADMVDENAGPGAFDGSGLLLTGDSGDSGDYASTPDHASLRITGDLTLRIEASPDSWEGGTTDTLIGRYRTTDNQRSYRLLKITDAFLRFQYSTTGTNFFSRTSTAAMPVALGLHAAEAKVDVDDGDDNHVVTFRVAPSMDGPWSQLGDPVETSGTIAIHAGTANLEVGSSNDGSGNRWSGVAHRSQVWSGDADDGGTLVANPRFDQQTRGTVGFLDSTGLPWTVNGNAEIVTITRRIDGLEVADATGLGTTVRARRRFPVVANEIERLGQLGGVVCELAQPPDEAVLRFTVREVQDLSAEVFFSAGRGNLYGFELESAHPEATVAVVAGRGEGADRLIRVRQRDVSTWGRWEAWVDARQTGDDDDDQATQEADLDDEGDVALSELRARENISADVVDLLDSPVRWRRDYQIGDLVGVTVDGDEHVAQVTEVTVEASGEGGTTYTPAVGGVTPRRRLDMLERLKTVEGRVDAQERVSTGGGAHDHAIETVGARITSTVAQSIPNNSLTQLTFNSTVYDLDGLADLSGNRLTCQTAGLYSCKLFVRINPGVEVRTQVRIRVNVSTIVLDDRLAISGTGGYNCTADILLEPGDHVTAHLFQTSGTAVDTSVELGAPALSVSMVGASTRTQGG